MSDRDAALARMHVRAWGDGFFSIDEEGRATVLPLGPDGPEVALDEVLVEVRRRGLRSPFLLRFPQILKERLRGLHGAFDAARREFGYEASYRGVYPIKVNQQRVVVEALVEESPAFRFGLETGSKGELLLALSQDLHPEALITCNGFKDDDVIELALRAHGAGRRVVLVAESPGEVERVLEMGRAIGVRPHVGLRLRLHSRGVGKWVESGGLRAKFGLDTGEILEILRMMSEQGAIDSLRLLHFHIGSQITDILAVKEAVREATRLFCHVKRRAPELDMLDLGGGLAVDYDGSRTSSPWSRNYDLEEYCRDCVYHVLNICEQEGMEPPTLITESGRALTALHAVAVVSPLKFIGAEGGRPVLLEEARCHQVQSMKELLDDLEPGNCRELMNDARQFHDEVQQAFNLGVVSLEDRAAAEALYLCIARRTLEWLRESDVDPDEVTDLETMVAPLMICNFSVFQTIPDAWAMRQVFPVMPLSRLLETDTVPASLGDITCDSDGRIDVFPHGPREEKRLLRLPRLDPSRPYRLGIFLVGAYQDTLGDFHNLFGSPNEVVVHVHEDGTIDVRRGHAASTVSDTTDLFGFSRRDVMARFEDRFGDEDTEQNQRLRDCFLRVLNSTTYLRR